MRQKMKWLVVGIGIGVSIGIFACLWDETVIKTWPLSFMTAALLIVSTMLIVSLVKKEPANEK